MGNAVFAAPSPSYHPLEYDGEFLWVPRDKSDPAVENGIPCLLLRKGTANSEPAAEPAPLQDIILNSPPGRPDLLLYFHANGEDLGLIYTFLRELAEELRVHVLAVEYPGYGVCSGAPSEETLLEDAEVVLRFAAGQLEIPTERILVMGRSLGAAAAIHLASNYACAGLVSLSAFSSVAAISGGLTSWFSADSFENSRRIAAVSCRTLIIHGEQDALVDVAQAQELHSQCGASCNNAPRAELRIVQGKGHNGFQAEDVTELIREVFPDIGKGVAPSLVCADECLRRRPALLAEDVRKRVPYNANYIPRGPPLGQLLTSELERPQVRMPWFKPIT